jgi:hypothetical protein
MQTKEFEETPGENFGVLRMRHQVINANSYVGGIFTSRLGMNGEQNYAYGLDGIFRLFGDDYLNVKAAQSYDTEIKSNPGSMDPSFLMMNWERRSEEGFAYNLNYSWSGQKFQPGIGFVQRPGMQGFQGGMLYGWMHGEKSKLFNSNVNIRGERYTRLSDGKQESLRIGPGFELNTKNEFGGEFSVEYVEEGVLEDFPLTDSIWIKSGDYFFTGIRGEIRTPQSKTVSAAIEIEGGGFFDGRNLGFEIESGLNLSASLQLSAAYGFKAIRFPDRETNNELNIHSANVKVLYMLNTKISATVILQYVNTEDDLIANFRLRYNPREGNDFYLVYNEYRGIQYERNEIPTPPAFYNRTIMLKYTHTFRF